MANGIPRKSRRHPPGSALEMGRRLLWLMLLRAGFTALLLGATILVQFKDLPYGLDSSLRLLYATIGGTFLLTVIYTFFFKRIDSGAFAFLQIMADTFLVSLIIYLTGGYESVFAFLYLIIIIYSSIFLGRLEILFIASLASLQYGALLFMEFSEVIVSFDSASPVSGQVDASLLAYKISMTTVACFLVAMLSGLLSEQERRTRRELWAVREHMRRVQKMAAIGEMSARLAHEIKNPLAALVGSVRMLREDMAPCDYQERLFSIVLREADRLNHLVSEFLAFARPVSAAPEPACVEDVVAEVTELFRKDDARRGVVIETDVRPDTWISMNPSHLKQVLWNLLANAADAGGDPPTIRITTLNAPEGQVLLRVADNGGGMDEKTLQCLFEPFFSTKPGGSGLGLSIVYRVLTAYDCRLDVESSLNQGSTFTIVAKRVNSLR